MSTDQSIFTYCFTCCGLACFSALEPWCNTKRYGCGSCGCGGQRGFCGSCFDGGFNKDSWDKDDEQRQERQEQLNAPTANATDPETQAQLQPTVADKAIQSEQPEAIPEMTPSSNLENKE